MEETVLICEDSQEGVFSAVYAAYVWKLDPAHTGIQTKEDGNYCLFRVYRKVETNRGKADKVAGTLYRRLGRDAYEQICRALCTEDERKAQAVYQAVVLGLSGKLKGRLMDALSEEAIRTVASLSRRAGNEAHHLLGFLRFREWKNGILYAQIEPKSAVLTMIMPHFADRFPQENFLIYDAGRGIYGIHPAGKEWFLADRDEMGEAWEEESEEERKMQELFRHFCHKISIDERENPALQRRMLPLRFRDFMTEFDGKLQKEEKSRESF